MTKTAKQDKTYSLTCLFSLLSEEDEAKKNAQGIKKWISEKGGSVVESSEIERQALSYPIQKHREALSWTLRFTLPTSSVQKLNQRINSNKDIIRSLLAVVTKSSKKKLALRPARRSLGAGESLGEVEPKTSLDSLKIIDKIEPLATEIKSTPPEPQKKETEKIKIEDLDQKLEEILNQPIN